MMKYTTDKGNCYTHFSRAEREEIAIGLERGESIHRRFSYTGTGGSMNKAILRNVKNYFGGVV